MEKDFNDVPLSESNVSLKLSEIQKRCSDFMNEPDTLELSLEDAPAEVEAPPEDPYNPYDNA